jgi:sulfur-carrier protein adenylyltransferase/sulfurtransferase
LPKVLPIACRGNVGSDARWAGRHVLHRCWLQLGLDNGQDFQVVDVRETFEYDIARIPGTRLIPLAQVVTRMNEIDPSRATVMHCKAGVRSAKAIAALKQAGFPGRLINLKGGITAWSDEGDPTVAKY